MTKERERLQFRWQKSLNDKMLIFTILIALVTLQTSLSERLPLWANWGLLFFLSITIMFFGLSYIESFVTETVYWNKGLKDFRRRLGKGERFYFHIKYWFNFAVGLIIILLGAYLGLVLTGILQNPV